MTETAPKIIKATKYDSLAFQFIEKVEKRKTMLNRFAHKDK